MGECLKHYHEDLSSDIKQTHKKLVMVVHAKNISFDWVETGRSLASVGQLVSPNW